MMVKIQPHGSTMTMNCGVIDMIVMDTSALFASSSKFVPPDVEQARRAAIARLRYPLNLGDCFAYALAKTRGCPIVTRDGDFKKADCEILSPP